MSPTADQALQHHTCVKGLGWSHVGYVVIGFGPDSMSYYDLRAVVSMGFPVMFFF